MVGKNAVSGVESGDVADVFGVVAGVIVEKRESAVGTGETSSAVEERRRRRTGDDGERVVGH